MSDIEIIRTEEVIAAEIRVIKEQTRVAVLSGAIEIGRRLAEAKAIVPHGQWGAWLEENVDYSERTAQNSHARVRGIWQKTKSAGICGFELFQGAGAVGFAVGRTLGVDRERRGGKHDHAGA